MNVFKGLLYLIENDAPAIPPRRELRRYGAATAAREFADELGNRAAARRRFGTYRTAEAANDSGRVEALGACC